MNVKKMADAKRIAVCKPSVTESKTPTVVPVNPEERKKTHKYGWVQDNQRKLIHGCKETKNAIFRDFKDGAGQRRVQI